MAMARAVRNTLVVAAAVAVALLALLLVLTRTDFGVERAGGLVLDRIRGSINGELEVGRIRSDGLLSGVMLHDVSITGPDGRPFVRADSARLAYRIRTLLAGSIVFDRLLVYGPDVVIERFPGQDRWNYERILGDTTDAAPDSARDGLVLIRDATVRGARVTVRLPWEPEGPVAPRDTARQIIEEVPGGLARVVRFEGVDARLPRIVWEAPDEEAQLFEIDELSGRAYVWRTPAEISSLEGTVAIRDSLISFEAPRVRLDASELSLVGRIILGEDLRYDIEVEGEDLVFGDFQWLYPPLPEEGGGSLRFRMQTQEDGNVLWLAREARLTAGGSRVAGSFGVVTGDTTYFTNVDLEASPLDLELLQRLVPAELPIEGLLIGTIEVDGPISALRTRGDLRLRTFADGQGAESAVRWTGTVGARRPWPVRELDAEIRGVELEQVAQAAPALRLRGTATGRLRARGSLEAGLDVTGDLALERPAGRSVLRGAGRLAIGREAGLDLRFDARPMALDLLAEQFPGLGRLTGEVNGPVLVAGPLDALTVNADLDTPAGQVLLDGRFDLADSIPGYEAHGRVTDFQLHRVATDLPETVVTGRFEIDGRGTTAEDAAARAELDLLAAHVAGVELHRGVIRAAVAGGVLRVDTLGLSSEVGEVEASGSFGLVDGRSGELAVRVRADSLIHLEPILFPDIDPVAFGSSPARLGGTIEATGSVSGSLARWSARGSALVDGLVYDELAIRRGNAEFDWRPDSASIDFAADSIRHGARSLQHARATVDWSEDQGRAVARVRGPGAQEVDLEGAFARSGDAFDVDLRQLGITTRDGRWALADTVRARVGRDGVRLDSLVLERAPHRATIRVAGRLPWRGPGATETRAADLTVRLDSVRLGELLRVAQVDTTIDGVVTGSFRVGGTARSPVLDGRWVARPFRYGGAVLDSVDGEVSYGQRMARTRFTGWSKGAVIVSGVGAVPMDLSLAERSERLLDEAMALRFRADHVPAGLVSFLAPGFREVAGTVDGEVNVLGTPRRPELEGMLQLTDGSGVFTPLGVRYRPIDAVVRMGAGPVVDLEATLGTGRGEARVTGSLDLTRPRDPGFDLDVRARRLQGARRRDVAAVVSGSATVGGRYTRPVISGDVRIIEGDMNLDEIWRQYQIVQLDPSLLQLFDSTAVAFRPPPEIPFLENLVLTDLTMTADREFWLRSRELNVEVSGRLDVEMDREVDDFRLTGTLQALDGSYALQLLQGVPGRTFDIRGGAIDFVGTPGIDPDLSIEAGYRVRRPQGDPIDVVARVSGTLKDPRVSLSSDSDLPLSETDLASYILFGRSGAELSQAETDVVSSGLGLVRPAATSFVSGEVQRALAGTGLPIDYVALSTPEYSRQQLGDYWHDQGLAGLFHNAQLEVGFDAGRYLSLVGSVRIPTDDGPAAAGTASALRMFGARLEYRPWPTWTLEGYIEDRFARTPSFGLTEIDDRKVMGLSFAREWGY